MENMNDQEEFWANEFGEEYRKRNASKEMLSATATIEFRLVDTEGDLGAALNGRVPGSSQLLRERDGKPVLLKKRVMLTGDHIVDAGSSFDE